MGPHAETILADHFTAWSLGTRMCPKRPSVPWLIFNSTEKASTWVNNATIPSQTKFQIPSILVMVQGCLNRCSLVSKARTGTNCCSWRKLSVDLWLSSAGAALAALGNSRRTSTETAASGDGNAYVVSTASFHRPSANNMLLVEFRLGILITNRSLPRSFNGPTPKRSSRRI